MFRSLLYWSCSAPIRGLLHLYIVSFYLSHRSLRGISEIVYSKPLVVMLTFFLLFIKNVLYT